MPATDEQLAAENLTFRAACRENTGRALCDSGDYYGRGWEKGVDPDSSPLTSLDVSSWNEDGTPKYTYPDVGATLHTGAFLDENVTIDRELQERFETYAANRPDPRETWEDALEAFFEEEMPGWTVQTMGNVYNEENDFSAMWTWTVLLRDDGDSGDWIYADEGDFIVIYRMHTGCDVRGGYGRPIFSTESVGEYVMPLDFGCDWYFQAPDKEENPTPLMPGMPEPPDMEESFCERWNDEGKGTRGYSSYPVGEVMKYVTRVYPETYKGPGTGVMVEVRFREDGQYGLDEADESADTVTANVLLFAEAPYIG